MIDPVFLLGMNSLVATVVVTVGSAVWMEIILALVLGTVAHFVVNCLLDNHRAISGISQLFLTIGAMLLLLNVSTPNLTSDAELCILKVGDLIAAVLSYYATAAVLRHRRKLSPQQRPKQQ